MKSILKLTILTFLLNLHLIHVAFAEQLKEEILEAYKNNKNIVLVFMPADLSSKLASNAGTEPLYDDWSYYLLTWAEKVQEKNTVFINLGSTNYKNFFNITFQHKSEYSLVFIKPGKPALYREDAILETYVYKYIEAYFNDKEDEVTLKDLIGTELDPEKNHKGNFPKWLGLKVIDLRPK